MLIVRVKATLPFTNVLQCLEQVYDASLQSTRQQNLLQANLGLA